MITDYSVSASGGARVIPEALNDLSLRQLLSFRAVAQQGSFHAAADELEYTQSAISQHVAGLEAALGVRLFDRGRGRRTVSLTEAGTLLLRHVDPIADRLQAARADLAAYAAGESGTLRVGVYQSVGTRILPRVMGRFAEAWPGVDVSLTAGATDEGLLDLVRPGQLDLTFGVMPLAPGPFEGIELLSDPFVLVAAAGSPLASLPGIATLDLIAQQPLIGSPSCRSTRWAEERMRASGLNPQYVFRSEDNGMVQAMASAGLGTALVPALSVDAGDPTIRVLPTELEPRRIALIWHRDRYRSPAAEAFVRITREVCAELATELDTRLTAAEAAARPADPGSAVSAA